MYGFEIEDLKFVQKIKTLRGIRQYDEFYVKFCIRTSVS